MINLFALMFLGLMSTADAAHRHPHPQPPRAAIQHVHRQNHRGPYWHNGHKYHKSAGIIWRWIPGHWQGRVWVRGHWVVHIRL